MTGPHANSPRPPLDRRALHRALVRPGGLWSQVDLVASTGSTNADLADLARRGGRQGMVLVAERQTAGRGRLARAWQAPDRSALTFSVLLRPLLPVGRLGWLPLLAGVAVAESVGRLGQVATGLKWPNDVLVGERKLAGVLAEVPVPGAVVLGIGVNISQTREELPVEAATSLALENALTVDRDAVLRAVLADLETWYQGWHARGGDPVASGLREAYTRLSATLGRRVRAELPAGATLSGVAVGVDDDGRLMIEDGEGREHRVSAGDVVHLR